MRKSILFSLSFLAGCGGDAPTTAPTYAIVPEVPGDAARVQCERVELEGFPAPTEIRLTNDSTWTVLDAAGRQVVELDDVLRVRSRTTFAAAGPGSADHAVSVAALGDTAWAVADRSGLRIVLLSRAGRELATIPLDFVPHSIEPLPDGALLVTAMPFGTKPPSLAVRISADSAAPLPLPRRSYQDMTVNALGNTALVETLSDGSALVIHQFLSPRAFRLGADGAVTTLTVPTPAGTRHTIEYVPHSPITEDQMPKTLLPAMAVSVDRGRREVHLLTRSGRELDGRPERVVLRLTEELAFLQGFLLDVPAAGLVYLPRTERAIVFDDEDRFFSCPLPHP